MSESQGRVLIVDDERAHINLLYDMLKERYQIKVALNGRQAIDRAGIDPQPDLILLDVRMPDMDGFQVLDRLKSDGRTRAIPVIFLTAMDGEADEARGLELGAVDYITKPFSRTVVNARIHTHLSLLRNTREKLEAQLQARSLRQQVGALSKGLAREALRHPDAFDGIVTNSCAMRAIFHYMEAIADSGEPVLITGETGVGKELIARGMHRLGGRTGRMVSVNLAGLDDATFSDTLFGHRRGAFTGAGQDREGLVRQAAGGTLFLDEIGDLAPASQIKLLRLLQEKRYYPLGSDVPERMAVSVIAATNRDPGHLLDDDDFRRDLFFRISTHRIALPPLRDRREDIPILTAHFLDEAGRAMGRPAPEAPPELLKLLELYHFPGNVRELRALLFDAVAQHRSGPVLSMKSIQNTIAERRASAPASGPQAGVPAPLPGFSIEGCLPTLQEAEGALVAEAMRQAGGNQGIAATLLGISRSALNRRLNRRLRHLNPSEG